LEHLNSFHDKATEVTVYKRGKDLSEQANLFASVLETIQNHGLKVGILGKDKADSPMIADWLQYVKEHGGNALTMVDVSAALSTLLAIKDEEEQLCLRTAAKCSNLILSDYVVDQLLTIIDDEKKVAHDSLSEQIEV
jgi:nucleosome binding factor SPN SPT16 subunit